MVTISLFLCRSWNLGIFVFVLNAEKLAYASQVYNYLSRFVIFFGCKSAAARFVFLAADFVSVFIQNYDMWQGVLLFVVPGRPCIGLPEFVPLFLCR